MGLESIKFPTTTYDAEVKQKQHEFLKQKQKLESLIGEYFGSFYFCFYDKLEKLDIPIQHKARFLYLCTFINYDGMLVDTDKKTSAVKPLALMDLKDKLGISKTEFYRLIGILKDHTLIRENDEGQFLVNERYVIRGTLSTSEKRKEFIRVFFDGVKTLYRGATPRQHRQIYHVFNLLPYINRSHNVVCFNPMEKDFLKIDPLRMQDVCEIIGTVRNQSSRMRGVFKNISIGDKDLLIFGDEHITINPKIFYGGLNSTDIIKLMEEFKFEYTETEIDISDTYIRDRLLLKCGKDLDSGASITELQNFIIEEENMIDVECDEDKVESMIKTLINKKYTENTDVCIRFTVSKNTKEVE